MLKKPFLIIISLLFLISLIPLTNSDIQEQSPAIFKRGANWDLYKDGSNFKKIMYMGAVNIQNESGDYIPFGDYVDISISNGNVVMSRGDKYSVSFMPIFQLSNGNQYYWSDIPSSIKKNLWKAQYRGKYKYGVDFSNVSTTIKNNLQYVILHRTASTGLTWDDIQIQDNSIIVKDKIKFSHDDILRNFTISKINKTDIVIDIQSSNFVDNGDGTWNISLDPTVSYNFSNETNVSALGVEYFDTASCDSLLVPPNVILPCSSSYDTVTTDSGLDSSDDIYYSIRTAKRNPENDYNPAIMRFRATIQEGISDINNITWTWEGKLSSTTSTYCDVYLWSIPTHTWTSSQNCESTTDVTRTFTELIASDWVNATDHNVYQLVYAITLGSTIQTLYTDFQSVVVNYNNNPPIYQSFTNNASGAIGTKINGVVNWSITVNDSTYGLSHYFFAHNNSGTLTNISNGSISGTSKFLNNTVTITKGRGNYICGQYWLNDTINNINQTLLTDSGACFTVNNTFPTMTSTELNKTSSVVDTDDLNCLAVGKADADIDDTTTYHYDWYNNSVVQGIDNVMLSNTNLTSGDSWYCEAWVTDEYDNSSKYSSSSVIIGSSQVSPVIITINATTEATGINSSSTNPTNNNSWVNMSVQSTDANGDARTAYICTVNHLQNCQANLSSEILCKSANNLTSDVLSCIFNVSGYTGTNPRTFYSFVLDNSSLYSSSKSATFEVNNHPDLQTLVNPLDNDYINTNHTLINWSVTDPNSDTINSTLYINSSSDFDLIYNGTEKGFNFTNTTEYTTYWWRVYTFDEHSYGYHNFTLGNFTFDWTKPNMTVTSPTQDSTYNAETVSLTINASDFKIGECNYTLYYKDSGSLKESNSSINCTGTSSLATPYYSGGYKIDVYAYDLAGNVNSTQINFTTAQAIASTGGGGAEEEEEKKEILPCGNLTKWKVTSMGDKNSIDTYFKLGGIQPKEFLIKSSNIGFENITIHLSCQEVENKSICNNVNLSLLDITLQPNIFQSKEVPIYLYLPSNYTLGEQYTFSILSTDNQCTQTLSVFAKVPQKYSILGTYLKLGQLELPKFATAVTLSFILFLIIFLIFNAFNFIYLAWWLGSISLIGSFLMITLIF